MKKELMLKKKIRHGNLLLCLLKNVL